MFSGKSIRAISIGAAILVGCILLIAIMETFTFISEGSPAPDFTAQVSSGDTVTLSQYAGKKNVVLFFYPKDFTQGCTQQVCSLRDAYADITALDAVVFGVSFDNDRSHRDFVKKYDLPFPLVSDQDKSLGKLYGATRLGGLWPMPKRVTYVIDKKGIIRKVAYHEFAIGDHLKDILKTLRAL